MNMPHMKEESLTAVHSLLGTILAYRLNLSTIATDEKKNVIKSTER